MIFIIGLIILVAAVVAGAAGVLSNSGSSHPLTHHFAVFGYHVTGSTGTLFLYGIAVGAVALVGLSLLLAGARRTSRRGHEARRRLTQSRRETAAVTQDRDDLIDQRETARAYIASTSRPGPAHGGLAAGGEGGGQRGRWRLFGPRSSSARAASSQAAAPSGPTANGYPVPGAPAGEVNSDVSAAAD